MINTSYSQIQSSKYPSIYKKRHIVFKLAFVHWFNSTRSYQNSPMTEGQNGNKSDLIQ